MTGFFGFAVLASTLVNIDALELQRAQFQFYADLTRAYTELALDHGEESWVDPDSGFGLMPAVPVLVATVKAHGSPLRDSLVPSFATAPGDRAREMALLRMVGNGFRVESSPNPVAGGARLELIETVDLVAARAGPCLVLTNAGPDGALTVSAPGNVRVRVTAESAVRGAAALGRELAPSRSTGFNLAAGSRADVVIPNIGDGELWKVRLEVPGATGPISVCGARFD